MVKAAVVLQNISCFKVTWLVVSKVSTTATQATLAFTACIGGTVQCGWLLLRRVVCVRVLTGVLVVYVTCNHFVAK